MFGLFVFVFINETCDKHTFTGVKISALNLNEIFFSHLYLCIANKYILNLELKTWLFFPFPYEGTHFQISRFKLMESTYEAYVDSQRNH